MPTNRKKIWEHPASGAVLAVAVAMWDAVTNGDISKYATIPVALFVVGVGQVIYALYHERNKLRDELDTVDLRRQIAKQLGKFLSDSVPYQQINALPDIGEMRRWEKRVIGYLSSEPLLGDAFVSRFGVGAGIQINIPAELQEAKRKEQKKWWCHIHTRRARLAEFIKEMRVTQ
jgi:hypothetical protein